MKKVKVDVWERIQLLQCVPQQGSIADIRKHLRLLDILELDEDVKKEIGLVQTTEGGVGWTSNMEFDLELEDADFDHLTKLVEGRTVWPTTKQTLLLRDKFTR